jgi:hypothetical protein
MNVYTLDIDTAVTTDDAILIKAALELTRPEDECVMVNYRWHGGEAASRLFLASAVLLTGQGLMHETLRSLSINRVRAPKP